MTKKAYLRVTRKELKNALKVSKGVLKDNDPFSITINKLNIPSHFEWEISKED